jgi:UPF0755 protein
MIKHIWGLANCMKILLKSLLYSIPSLVLVFLLAFSWFIEDYKKWSYSPNDSDKKSLVVIEKNQTVANIFDKLKKHNLIDSSLYFYILVRFDNRKRSIKYGEFTIKPYSTPRQIFDAITKSQKKQFAFSIIEGTRVKDLLEKISKVDNIKHTLQNDKQKIVAEKLNIKYPSIEGLFLAETYFYSKHNTDMSILKRSHNDLMVFLQQQWQKRADNLPYKDPYEALIMASIIEKETGVASERALISGVFYNRLKKGMRLQTDPTVIYGVGDKYKGDIRYKDLRDKNPYNTYVIYGLPPTPIAISSRASIIAALHPAETTALYFVASGDGGHKFSNNLKEHNEAVNKYLRSNK